MPWGRGYTQPPGWSATRARVLARDGHRCYVYDVAVCVGMATEVDHLINQATGGSHDDANLRAICAPCHRRKTAAEASAARPRRARPAGKHPGIL